MRKPTSAIVLSICAIALMGASVQAQEFGDVGDVFRENLDRLKGYTWKAQVDFTVDGKHKRTQIYDVDYGKDGRLTRTLVSDEGKQDKNQAIAATELSSIRQQIDAYTHMKAEDFAEAFGREARRVQADPETGLTRVATQNFLRRGDKVVAYVDSKNYKMRRLEIDMVAGKSPLRVVAYFEDLDNGLTVAMRHTLKMQHKKKALILETQNTAYSAP